MKRGLSFLSVAILLTIAACSSSKRPNYGPMNIVTEEVLRDLHPRSSDEEIMVFSAEQFFGGDCFVYEDDPSDPWYLIEEEPLRGQDLLLHDENLNESQTAWRPDQTIFPTIPRSEYEVIAELGFNGNGEKPILESLISACRRLGANGLVLLSSEKIYEYVKVQGTPGPHGGTPAYTQKIHIGCAIQAWAVTHSQGGTGHRTP